MQSSTSGRARTSRSQGTRGRRSSAALTSSVSPASTPSGTYESQSSTGSLPIPSQIGQSEAPNPLQSKSGVPTEEKNDEQNLHPSPSSQSGVDNRQERFPNQLHKMIEDKQMVAYIRWDGLDVFCVPNVEEFEKHALKVYFRRMQDWGSFHRQLSNYEFEKQDWGSGLYKFSHRHKKFCQGRKDLLHEVVSKPKQQTTSTPQIEIPVQPLNPSTPSFPDSIPQPSADQAELNARISRLEYLLSQLTVGSAQQSAKETRLLAKEKRLFAQEKRLLSRERRLLTRETRLFAKEKRLAAKERQLEGKGKGFPAKERQLDKEFRRQELASEQPAISTGTGSSYPTDQTGSAGAAFDQDSDMCDAGEFHDAHDEMPWSLDIGTTDGNNVPDPFSYPETKTTLHTPDSAPFDGQPPYPQTPGSPLPTDLIFPSPSDHIPSSPSDYIPSSPSYLPSNLIPSSPYANEQQDSYEHHPGSPALAERVATWHDSHFNPFSGTWWRDSFTAAPTNPQSVSTKAASAPGSRFTSVAQVPSRLRPG